MTFDRLEKNICDNIYEAQLKLDYDHRPMSLNYTNSSLCHLMGINDSAQLPQLLEKFADSVAQKLGKLTFHSTKNGFCITIPSEGTAYVNAQSSGYGFMKRLVEAVRDHADTEKILGIFREASENVSITEINNEEFRYLACFPDMKPDEYYYCISEEEEIDGSIHASYHRFIREDYEELGF